MKTILVIEDDQSFRRAILKGLRSGGYETLEADSGDVGISLARQQLPNLVVSDVNMNGLDGFGVLQALRTQTVTSAIPVILMTGGAGKSDMRHGMELGADDYLQKPFQIDALLAAVRVRLERQQRIEAQAKSNETALLEILSATQDLVAIADAESERLRYLNLAGRKMLSVGEKEDISHLGLGDIHVDSQAARSSSPPVASAKTRGVWVGESAFLSRKGRRIPVSMQILAHPASAGGPAYLSIVARDLTERLVAEKALRESENLYRSLIQSQGEGFVIVNPELQFEFANPAAETIFNLPPGQLVGRNVHEFLNELGNATVTEQLALRKAAKRSSFELELVLGAERRQVLVTGTPKLDAAGHFCGTYAVFRDITERKRAEEKLHLLTSALEAAANGVVISDCNGHILWVNPAFTRLTGYSAAEAVGNTPAVLKSGVHQQGFYETLWRTILGGQVWHGELVNRRKDGSEYEEEMTITPVMGENGKVQNFVAIKQDITERKKAELERRRIEVQLRQAQKLEAIGQLAAGIAHEINTPTQYVGDNTRFLQDSFSSIAAVLQAYGELLATAKGNNVAPELVRRLEELILANDLEYLFEQIPAAIKETLEGVERVTKIVRAMKEFSHPGGKEKNANDLNKAIETTVTVARNEWKYVAEMVLELDPQLPFVPCFVGEFNQVILNLVVNAAHAIGDVVKRNPGSKGTITIRTRRDGDDVEVRVSDTGTGIPESARSRIFEPFFTTKDVGKGTGQGLTIVYGSIVKKHGGSVTFETELGKGTTFIVRLPITPRMPAPAEEPPAASPAQSPPPDPVSP